MQTSPDEAIERRSGVALWRQIADRIRLGIAEGLADDAGRLPTEMALAGRFGVNRHTVRTAIQALVQEGVLRSEQGRGTFVEGPRRLSYPIRARTRFSAGLAGQARERRGHLLSHAYEPAPPQAAEALGLAPETAILRLETVSQADGRPVSRATSYFPAARFAGLEKHFADTGSITAALAALGVPDYVRATTRISARHADSADLAHLKLSPGAIVLITFAVNADSAGIPIQYSLTRFAADRVELQVDGEG
ncbi:phosphonate metabolism transcriptional regulator PhnF [Nitratireductor thuwali]|uniref:HTH-type transcriptional regulator YurK n=1 Tax=Nitratireductor thuwali TaxID=2267699 RepID=A0ABY5MLG5_9HYPH|nr:putative HTH-type transcriptional regulator YurK [Nitratireductor thuwali]